MSDEAETFDALACPLDSYRVIEWPQAGGGRWLVTVNPTDGSYFPICQLTGGEHPFAAVVRDRGMVIGALRAATLKLDAIVRIVNASRDGQLSPGARLAGCKGTALEGIRLIEKILKERP